MVTTTTTPTNKEELAIINVMALVASMIEQTYNCALMWNLTAPRQYHAAAGIYDFYLGQTVSSTDVYALDVWKNGVFLKDYNSINTADIDTLFNAVDALPDFSTANKFKNIVNMLAAHQGCGGSVQNITMNGSVVGGGAAVVKGSSHHVMSGGVKGAGTNG